MLIVISPAKKLDYKIDSITQLNTMPHLLEHSKILIDELRKCSIEDLTKLMNISYGLAETNLKRFSEWKVPHSKKDAKQAILAFNGDVYTGIDAKSFDDKDFEVAQNTIRIISGLYGVLRPLDLILPHRLSMGTKLTNDRGRNLYEFWDEIITDQLNNALTETKNEILVNLASNEYSKAIKKDNIDAQIVDVVFKENKNGIYRVVSFYAKKARGLMSRFVIKNNIKTIDELKSFNLDGYSFDISQSEESKLVFVR
jgi:uncharacterized protein